MRSLRWLNARIVKAIRVKSREDINKAQDYYTDAVLFDTHDPKVYGGSGKRFDWNMIGDFDRRVFLAGGINPENAVEAVETGVYGIDICSGIESAPGKKDHEKMKRLFENIHDIRG